MSRFKPLSWSAVASCLVSNGVPLYQAHDRAASHRHMIALSLIDA
jgi:hypothetical protein